MSFSGIRLPNSLLVDLYKTVLVDTPEKTQHPAELEMAGQAAPSETNYLGKNLKNCVILVNYLQEKFLPEEQLNFLTAILKACNLTLEDIAIVNTAHGPKNIRQFVAELSPQTILFFSTSSLSVMELAPMTDFYITDIDGISMVCSPPLEHLNQNNNDSKLLKRKLWECLKQIFKI